MRHAARRMVLLALAAVLCAGACSTHPKVQDGPRLVVLYTASALNRAFLEPYGGARPTPACARFARQGLVFDRHQTEAGQSDIARASLLSGTQAWQHGIYGHPSPVSAAPWPIDEAFAREGWETRSWSGRDAAIGADFEALLADLAADPSRKAFVRIESTLAHDAFAASIPAADLPRVSSALAAELGLPRAQVEDALALHETLRVELCWDHARAIERSGLDAAGEVRLARVLEALYARAVRDLDDQFGRFLERLDAHGLAGVSLIAFTADHGEVLDRPNALFRWGHGLQLAPEVIEVPLVLRGPGVEAGRYGAVSRSVDVFPTLAGLAWGRLEHAGEGTNLASSVRAESPPPEQVAFSHGAVLSPAQVQAGLELRDTFFPTSDPAHMWTAMRAGDRYYLLRKRDAATWGLQVYDLAADPGLERDLFDPDDPEHEDVTNRLASYRAQLIEGYVRVLRAARRPAQR